MICSEALHQLNSTCDRCLKKCGFKTRFVVCAVLIGLYFYLLSLKGGWTDDDVVISSTQYIHVLAVIHFLYTLHAWNIHYYLYILFRDVSLFGWFRVFLYYASLVVVACFLVFATDDLTIFSYKTFGNEVIRRLEDSIVRIREERPVPVETVQHPVTMGKEDPKFLHKLFRYPMEDVQMTCTASEFLWFSGKPLKQNHITWRLNGIPLQFTDRHNLEITSEPSEIPYTIQTGKNIDAYGLGMYTVTSTLTISLLRDADFGSYTCHIENTKRGLISEYVIFWECLYNIAWCKPTSDPQPLLQCEQVPIAGYMPQDTITWEKEYRVIPLEGKQHNLTLPPASILSFTTHYMSLQKDDIDVEYLVDGNDFFELCPDQLYGCSRVLLYYWLHGSELRPPFRRWYFRSDFRSWTEISEHAHCLCEHSYGMHSVRYLRRYFNQTKGQYELIEITHPHTLAIIPREQTMLAPNFVPRCKYDAELATKQSAEETMSYFEAVIANMKIRTELAIAMVKLFHWNEVAFLLIVIVLCVSCFFPLTSFLGCLGHSIRQCTLHGSLAYISNNKVLENDVSYDVFVSYSDDVRDVNIAREIVTPRLEAFGSRVCVPDRNLPPNEQELSALEKAIESSKRFIIFLSRDYAQDRFRQEFETNMIIESVVARPAEPKQILIVRLDTCEVPLSLRHLPVYDWAGNLTDEEHVLWLRRWLEPVKCAARVRCLLDAAVTLLPLGLTLSVLTMYKLYSFLD